MKEWDTCAPEAILRAAGGLVTDCVGAPLRYNKADIKQPYGIIATNGRVHDAFRRELIPVCESRGWPRREPQ